MSKPESAEVVASHELLDRVMIGVKWNYRYGPVKRMLKEELNEFGSTILLAVGSTLLVPLMLLAFIWNVAYHFISPFWLAIVHRKPDFWEKHKRSNGGDQA